LFSKIFALIGNPPEAIQTTLVNGLVTQLNPATGIIGAPNLSGWRRDCGRRRSSNRNGPSDDGWTPAAAGVCEAAVSFRHYGSPAPPVPLERPRPDQVHLEVLQAGYD
jgi:hypothetical protein